MSASDRLTLLTVVAYDIADDRRRSRLAAALEDYGIRLGGPAGDYNPR